MFDPDNSDHLVSSTINFSSQIINFQDRINALKAQTELITQFSTADGKKLVDFKWSNCMEWNYDQSLSGVKTNENNIKSELEDENAIIG